MAASTFIFVFIGVSVVTTKVMNTLLLLYHSGCHTGFKQRTAVCIGHIFLYGQSKAASGRTDTLTRNAAGTQGNPSHPTPLQVDWLPDQRGNQNPNCSISRAFYGERQYLKSLRSSAGHLLQKTHSKKRITDRPLQVHVYYRKQKMKPDFERTLEGS